MQDEVHASGAGATDDLANVESWRNFRDLVATEMCGQKESKRTAAVFSKADLEKGSYYARMIDIESGSYSSRVYVADAAHGAWCEDVPSVIYVEPFGTAYLEIPHAEAYEWWNQLPIGFDEAWACSPNHFYGDSSDMEYGQNEHPYYSTGDDLEDVIVDTGAANDVVPTYTPTGPMPADAWLNDVQYRFARGPPADWGFTRKRASRDHTPYSTSSEKEIINQIPGQQAPAVESDD